MMRASLPGGSPSSALGDFRWEASLSPIAAESLRIPETTARGIGCYPAVPQSGKSLSPRDSYHGMPSHSPLASNRRRVHKSRPTRQEEVLWPT